MKLFPVIDLVALGVEFVTNTGTGIDIFRAADLPHMAENGGDLLALGIEAHFTVKVQRNRCLGLADGSAQLLAFLQHQLVDLVLETESFFQIHNMNHSFLLLRRSYNKKE